MERPVGRGDGRANRGNRDPDEVADRAGYTGFKKLKPRGRLREKIQRHHEK